MVDERKNRVKGIVVLISGIGLIVAAVIIFFISCLYQALVGKKIIKELLDKYD